MADVGKEVLGGINAALGTSENNPQNPENVYSYEALKDFQDQINKFEERVYLQGGYTRKLKPQAIEVLLQEPDVTIVVKKRQFSSLAENYRLDRADRNTRTYIKAVKRLFYNKCRAIAAYERLTKLEKIYHQSNGQFDDILFPFVLAVGDVFTSVTSLTDSVFAKSIRENFAVFDTLKNVKYLGDPQYYTTWSPSDLPYLADVGDGTGTFEITLAASVSTSVSTKFGGGSANITLENPLELMIITQEDIEQAISDVVGFSSQGIFTFIKTQLRDQIKRLASDLSTLRLSRGASSITIQDAPNSLNYKKVRAFIDEDGREIIFNYDPGLAGIGSGVDLDATALQGPNGLQGQEIGLFNQIILNYFSLIDNEKFTRNEIINFNKENDYVRKKMRLEFEDRPIIQQQDLVHIFMSSKTSVEPRISAGFDTSFSKNNFFNQADKILANIEDVVNQISSAFSSRGSNYLETERNAIAGPQFPLWMWLMMRNEFTRQAAGTHVFAGIVNNASQEYSNGKHTVGVNCSDFTEFLNKGQINIQPSLDVIDSSIYDPLTPFKTDYDPATGVLQGEQPQLLDENMAILATDVVRFKAGRSRGEVVNIDNYGLTDVEILTPESPEAKKRVKFFDPDGFVYRWKEGIGTLVLSGAPHKLGTGSLRKETSTLVTSSPWQGQDVMNTLSLLITGQPYNFSTFLKAAVNSSFVTVDKRLSYSSSENFLKGLISDIKKNNTVWGNFVPFKRVTLSDATYQAMLSGEVDVALNTQKINKLLREKAEKVDQIVAGYSASGVVDPNYFRIDVNNTPAIDANSSKALIPDQLKIIGTSIFKLDIEIANAQNSLLQSLGNKNLAGKAKIKIAGDDISIQEADQSSASTERKIREREETRKKLLFLTQRRLWKVKANDDPNFFIVDDSYDKNYDIQAFEEALAGNPNLFKSTYDTIGNLAKKAADILDLELFADSQGHINARAPAYNRIPSSVLFNLIQIKNEKGIKLFPEYLENLFFNQIKGLTDRLEVLEDQIRLRATLLGANNDFEIGKLLGGSKEVGAGNEGFFFPITDGTTGRIDVDGFNRIFLQNNPDFTEDANRKALSALNSKVSLAVNLSVQFDIVKRVNIISSPLKESPNPSRIDDIIKRLEAKFFTDPLVKDIGNYKSTKNYLKQVRVLELMSQLTPLISERQNVVKLLANATRTLEEGTNVNNTKVGETVLFSTLNSKSFSSKKIPEILLHMVEDEDVDDLGPGAGSRYIIKDSHIINFTLSEKAPDFTVAEVNGSFTNKLVNEDAGLGIGQQGNLMNTAIVVDYDMWRLYGFKGVQPFDVGYLSDPEAQCAPFGVFRLNQARKRIFTADITVKGNEYLQAGEVYYLESRDLLMYAETVSHRFSWDGQFQTTLNCTYVRKPGEFIPTMLDIIGKGLYTRRNSAELIKNSRNSSPSDDVHIAVLKATGTGSIESEDFLTFNSPAAGSFKEMNRKAISSILLNLQGVLAGSTYDQPRRIELRIYGISSVDSKLEDEAVEFVNLILSPEKFIDSSSSEVVVPDDYITPKIERDMIKVTRVLFSNPDQREPRSPSTQAWELARRLSEFSSKSDNNKVKDMATADLNNLLTYVIDVWAVKMDALESGVETSNSNNASSNQNQQQKEKELQAKIDQKIFNLSQKFKFEGYEPEGI